MSATPPPTKSFFEWLAERFEATEDFKNGHMLLRMCGMFLVGLGVGIAIGVL